MRQKIANYILAAIEVGCIAALTGGGIYAECKRLKAEKELRQEKLKRSIYEFGCWVKDRKIKDLEKELEELKSQGKA